MQSFLRWGRSFSRLQQPPNEDSEPLVSPTVQNVRSEDLDRLNHPSTFPFKHDNSEPTEYFQKNSRTFHKTCCLKVLGLLIVVGLAVWGLVDLATLTLVHIHQTEPTCYCGKSVSDALSRGCTYDRLASAWLPKECIDEELSKEFDEAGPGPNGKWDYFVDENGTKTLDVSELGAYADSPHARYWTTLEWHITHCFYYWRKQYRSQYTEILMEKRYDNEGHIQHCGQIFLTRGNLSGIMTHSGAVLES
jgi:hypothetical protein